MKVEITHRASNPLSLLIFAFLVVVFTGGNLIAQTCPTPGAYTPSYATDNGAGNWATSGDWLATGAAPAPVPGGAPPAAWISGGVLTIPFGVIVKINSSNFSLTGLSLVVSGKLVVDGKLAIDAGQSVTISLGAILCCEGVNCNSNSDRISIGGTPIWDGNDGPITGYATSTGGPLPVQLLFFNAKSAGSDVVLKWATATERNAEYFAIEKSLNGKDFTEIGREPASGNSIFRVDYSFVDDKALLGRAYYRLREVDYDGSFEYFNITFADTEGNKIVSVYPNPVKDNQLKIYLNWTTEDVVNAKIYNSSGMVVNSFSFKGTEYSGENNLRAGTYILKVSEGKNHFTSKFVVQ